MVFKVRDLFVSEIVFYVLKDVVCLNLVLIGKVISEVEMFCCVKYDFIVKIIVVD